MWSWHIGSIRDIDLKIHLTFPLVLVWAAIQFGTGRDDPYSFGLYGASLVLLLFGCVLLHELGHALAALRFGIPVTEIILLPIGGLARLRVLNDDPKQEFVIAAAGPLVNFVIALLLLPLLALLISWLEPDIMHTLIGERRPAQALLLLLRESMQRISLVGAVVYLCFANIMLGIFNLIPAFPMDGGRLFRALLAILLRYDLATKLAVRIGQLAAIILAVWGVRTNNWSILLISTFILISGQSELQRLALRQVLIQGQVRDYMRRRPHSLYPDWSLHSALLLTEQTGQLAFPVIENDNILGLLTIREIQGNLSATTVKDTMIKEFIRLDPERTLYQAQVALQAQDHFAGAVIEKGVLLGLLSHDDIERAYRVLRLEPAVHVV
ncbi:MAG: site-2 protease family protein [Ardenticatenaceae bacterium]